MKLTKVNDMQRFVKFVEKLKTDNNHDLIESIMNGYNTVMEGGMPRGDIGYQPSTAVISLTSPIPNHIDGGQADDSSVENIAECGNVTVEDIIEQLKLGANVELEHTDDPMKAIEIAMDHLAEIPDYYDRLDVMETEATTLDVG